MLGKIKENWKKKSTFSKISDVVFFAILVSLLFPQGRLAIGGFVNRIKSKIDNPKLLDEQKKLTASDFDWKLKSTENEVINLSQVQGKVIFINLWATWCPPCVGEMPEIESLYKKYKDNENIKFFLISNEDIGKINNFRNSKSYSFPVYQSLQSFPNVFSSRNIPTTFVISKDGKIVIRKTGVSNWGGKKMVAILDKLIKEKGASN